MTVNVTNTVGANNTIVLDGSSKIPAIDGSLVTALSATAFTTGTLAIARIDVGTTAGKVLQLDGSARMPALNATNLVNAPGPTVSTSDPAIDTNPTLGAKWIKKTSGEVYICTDATTDANTWTNVGAGSGDILSNDGVQQGSSYGFTVGGKQGSGGSWAETNVIDKFAFASSANAVDHGDLVLTRFQGVTASSTLYGYISHGEIANNKTFTNAIDKFQNATASNATDVGDLLTTGYEAQGCNSSVHGYVCGGTTAYPYAVTNTIQRYSFATDGNAVDHNADLYTTRNSGFGVNHADYGFTGGGYSGNNDTPALTSIDRFPFASSTNATDWADISEKKVRSAGLSSTTHGYIAAAYQYNDASPNAYSNEIEKFPFASQSNSTDVGDLLEIGDEGVAGHSTATYGYVSAMYKYPETYLNRIERFSFSSDGNSTDVGDMTVARYGGRGTQL